MASLSKLWKSFFYLGDTIEDRGGAANSAIRRIRSGWSKFRHLAFLLASGGFALGAKGKLYSDVYIVLCCK